jgi:hypothetical protein
MTHWRKVRQLTNQVPKIIWQTHEWEYSELPENLKKATMTWRNLNPTWEHRYVSAKERKEYVKSNNPFHSRLYLFYCAAEGTTQADIWRYLVLYNNGGVYADMDSVCSEPLDQSFKDVGPGVDVISEQSDHNGQTNNSNFAAIKFSKVMKDTLGHIVNVLYKLVRAELVLASVESGMSLNDAVQYEIGLGPQHFTTAIEDNIELVWRDYKGFIHSSDIWDPNWNFIYEVDYHGEKKQYLDLARDNNWSLV